MFAFPGCRLWQEASEVFRLLLCKVPTRLTGLGHTLGSFPAETRLIVCGHHYSGNHPPDRCLVASSLHLPSGLSLFLEPSSILGNFDSKCSFLLALPVPINGPLPGSPGLYF